MSNGSDDIKPVEKRLVIVEDAVAIGVFMDGDLVVAALVVGWRERNLVVSCTPIVVATDDLQTRGRGILKVLNDPQTAALVEIDEHRLADNRLRQNEIERKIVGCGETLLSERSRGRREYGGGR